MRAIFMGTPDFAVNSLKALLQEKHEICAVFSQPDKPRGRGHKLMLTPVKQLALEVDLPVFQPQTLRDESIADQIRSLNPDIIVVVAYGKLLPKEILDIPKYGCVNVHASLLPKYRGAAPIQWAVINGEEKTGVTTMCMAQGMDTGDILLQEETEILPGETAGELFERLAVMGAQLLGKTLKGLEKGGIVPKPQCEEQASLAPMIRKSDAQIDWSRSATEIYNMVRGMHPSPCAYTIYRGAKMKIHSCEVLSLDGTPGTLAQHGGGLLVFCGEGALSLNQIQPENGKRMDGKSFLAGHRLAENEHFESAQ